MQEYGCIFHPGYYIQFPNGNITKEQLHTMKQGLETKIREFAEIEDDDFFIVELEKG